MTAAKAIRPDVGHEFAKVDTTRAAATGRSG
jgi:hypothetical protein